uniref:Bet v I/Major latex protein domain-containing protein n=1 Tax=Brassica oleracea TaxID=3712 RepID=A0A3P6HDR7_BRAOL|nr:unnamed protein product [Brassica oleracea]
MAEAATEIAKKMEEEEETPVTVAPTKKVEATSKPAEEEVKTTETSSLLGKLEAYVEIKASAEKFHHMFTAKPHHVSKVSPGNIQGYGEAKVAKERIEEVDPETNLISFRVIEGDLMKEYKSFLATIQVAPKHGGTGSIVHWHFDYEKISEEVAHPQTLLQLWVEMSKEIDEHLLSEE